MYLYRRDCALILGAVRRHIAVRPSCLCSLLTEHADTFAGISIVPLHSALATRWPRLHRLSPWFDEVFLVASLLVESRFLASHTCLLSESFYGLRRCRYGPNSGPPGEKRSSSRTMNRRAITIFALTITPTKQETPAKRSLRAGCVYFHLILLYRMRFSKRARCTVQ